MNLPVFLVSQIGSIIYFLILSTGLILSIKNRKYNTFVATMLHIAFCLLIISWFISFAFAIGLNYFSNAAMNGGGQQAYAQLAMLRQAHLIAHFVIMPMNPAGWILLIIAIQKSLKPKQSYATPLSTEENNA